MRGRGGGPGGGQVVGMGRLVGTFIRPERVLVWQSKERAPETDGIGRLEQSRGSLDR